MTATVKVAVSVPADVIEHARSASDGNLSAYVTRALRAALLEDGMREYARLRGADDHDDWYAAAEEDAG